MTTTGGEIATREWVGDFVGRWPAAWNSHQAERVLELMTEGIVYDDLARPQTVRGHIQVRVLLDALWRAFPDLTFEHVGRPLVATDGARAAFQWRARGTNLGPWRVRGAPTVAPTGKFAEFGGADFEEYRDGKVSRIQIVWRRGRRLAADRHPEPGELG